MGYKYKRGEKYESRNEELIDGIEKQYTERSFDYDPETDEAYQSYADMMRRNGKTAMTDTVGKASAMTGGYGNSYAVTAGQQTYNNYLSQIDSAQNDFYNQALSRYNAEGDALLGKLNVLQNRESADKTAWEEDYLSDLESAEKDARFGNYANIADFYGTDEETYLNTLASEYSAGLNAPTLDILNAAASEYMKKGYFENDLSEEELISNITQKYVYMGYDGDAIAEHLVQTRSNSENVADRKWTYVSGSGKDALYRDQFGNEFFYDELENWTLEQSDKDAWKALKAKLKALKKS